VGLEQRGRRRVGGDLQPPVPQLRDLPDEDLQLDDVAAALAEAFEKLELEFLRTQVHLILLGLLEVADQVVEGLDHLAVAPLAQAEDAGEKAEGAKK